MFALFATQPSTVFLATKYKIANWEHTKGNVTAGLLIHHIALLCRLDLRTCVCVRTCAHAYLRAYACVLSAYIYTRTCMRAHAYMCACLGACLRVCVLTCVRAYVRACLRACVHTCVRASGVRL